MTQAPLPILAADVGGTNTRIALLDGTTLRPDTVRRFPNDDFDSLAEVLATYRGGQSDALSAACVAVAGPVRDGVGRLTNRAWEITAQAVCSAAHAPVAYVINDLEAQGHALNHVTPTPLLGTLPGNGASTRLVIGVGTGFNAVPVHRTRTGWHVAASESGHVSLPVWDETSLQIARKMVAQIGFASVEEALSGRGLHRLYEHFAPSSAPRSGAEILKEATESQNSPAAQAVQLMARLLGRVAGDLALIHLPAGGVFLVGGMSRALSPWLSGPDFTDGYQDKGRFSGLVQEIPVALIEDDYAALTGCAGFVQEHV